LELSVKSSEVLVPDNTKGQHYKVLTHICKHKLLDQTQKPMFYKKVLIKGVEVGKIILLSATENIAHKSYFTFFTYFHYQIIFTQKEKVLMHCF